MDVRMLFFHTINFLAYYFLLFVWFITGEDCMYLLYTRMFYIMFSVVVISVVLVLTLLFSLLYFRVSIRIKEDRHVV
nr:putative 7 protein [Infectious bronchitis virus]UOF83502.1 putative 7 protein [Infectious bronchitis virus]